MIRIIPAQSPGFRRENLASMFQLRKAVFHDLLKWDVNVVDGWEIDHFDDANPVYVLSHDGEEGPLRGALRLLPTLGPNMLDDVFPELLGDNPEIRSASVWESSRFCIDPALTQNRASNQVTVAAAELMCGVGEFSLQQGITHIATVTDLLLERMFRRMGCPGERLGPAIRIGSTTAVAIAWEVDETMLKTMKTVAGLEGQLVKEPIHLPASAAMPAQRSA